MLALITGFIYTPGQTGNCSSAIFTYLGAWLNSIDAFPKIYLPWVWPLLQAVIQDIIAGGSAVIYDCDANKLFLTLTHLITTEGLSELGARAAGAAPFELYQLIVTFQDETIVAQEKARQCGKLTATLLNFYIQ